MEIKNDKNWLTVMVQYRQTKREYSCKKLNSWIDPDPED